MNSQKRKKKYLGKGRRWLTRMASMRRENGFQEKEKICTL